MPLGSEGRGNAPLVVACGKAAGALRRLPDDPRVKGGHPEEDKEDPMSTIVVGTDGSESAWRALEKALDLARALGDGLVLVTAWRELHGDFGLPLDTLVPSLELADIEREWAERTLA